MFISIAIDRAEEVGVGLIDRSGAGIDRRRITEGGK